MGDDERREESGGVAVDVSGDERLAEKLAQRLEGLCDECSGKGCSDCDGTGKIGTAPPPKMSSEQKRDFVLGVCQGTIFTNRHLKDPSLFPKVFSPFLFGGRKLAPRDLSTLGCVWAPLDQALPKSINGHPMFVIANVMHADDARECFEAIDLELERRKNLEVGGGSGGAG